MDFDIEKGSLQVMKSGERHLTEGVKLPNRRSNQKAMRNLKKNITSEEPENYLRQNSTVGTLSKG